MKNRVLGFRKLRRLTLDDVSQAVHIDRGHLWRIEQGTARPSAAVKDRLAAFFGVPAFVLFPENGEKRD